MAVIESGSGLGVLEVSSVSKAARATLFDNLGNSAIVLENDQPSVASGLVAFGYNDKSALPLRLDRLGSLATTLFTPLFQDSFEGSLSVQRWNNLVSGFAALSSAVSGITLNSGNSVAANNGWLMQTVRRFQKSLRSPLQVKFRARIVPANNSVIEMGFADATSFNGANTTGAYWQVASSGAVQPVVTYNGVDQTGLDIRSLLSPANHYTWDVFMDDDESVFVCQDTSTGSLVSKQSIKLPSTAQRILSTTQIGVHFRVFTTATAPATAPSISITDVQVICLDQTNTKPFADIQALNGRSSSENPITGVPTINYVNSIEANTAVLANATASYATLGGRFLFTSVAGSSTDYALFGFQVPTPASFVLTGVDIDVYNLGAISAGGITLMNFTIGVNSPSVNLSTANILRSIIGSLSVPVGTGIGQSIGRLSKTFRTPLVAGPGRFVHLILRMPVGSVTAAQSIAGMVNIEGYFE